MMLYKAILLKNTYSSRDEHEHIFKATGTPAAAAAVTK